MGQSGDKKRRETYDPFKEPRNSGTNPGGGNPRGFGYPGGGDRGGNGYGYTGGSGAGGNTQNNGSFYGPDYFTGRSGYGFAGGSSGGYGYPGGAPTGPRPVTRSPGYYYAVASAILGGVALLLCLSVGVSLITGVLAIVFSLLARKRDGKFTSASLAGLILGVVALVLVALLFTYLIQHFDEVEAFLKQWWEETMPQSPNGGNSGGSGTPDTSGGNGRQLAWLPLWRL